MGKIIEISGENMTLTTGIRQLFILNSAAVGSAASNLFVKRVEISQSGTAVLAMVRGAFATQTGTTITAVSATPRVTRPLGGAASGLTGSTSPGGAVGRCGVNLSVNTTPGYTDHHPFNFPNLNGYLWVPTPETEIWIPPSTLWGIYFLADPSDLDGWTVSVVLDEN